MGQSIVNWSILDNDTVNRILLREASKVARQYDGVIEADDVLQEARIAVATNSHIVNNYLAHEDYGYLARWIWQRMTDAARKQLRIAPSPVSWQDFAE